MPDNLTLRQMPRDKLFAVFKTQEGVDLYEALLRQAGTIGPQNTSAAQATATAAATAAATAQITAEAANANANTRLLAADMTGAVQWFACNTPPTNWLECNGAAVSRTTYAALFGRIGTVFGVGDGSTTFNVPELRGEFVRGWDNGRGIDPARVFGSAQTDEFESHTHTVNGANSYLSTAGGGAVANTPGADFSAGASVVLDPTGGSETRPRNIALLPCIHV